ncbi:MAG: hypothetical protein PHN19_04895 [Patescibacteria group bacterium]|nr:hypothetical protein [Patescibacteria group bacterium]
MKTIKVILDRFFDDSVILITESGKQILWPKDKLPEEAELGQTLHLTLNSNQPLTNNLSTKIKTTEETKEDHSKIAKAILEEILNGSEQEKIE